MRRRMLTLLLAPVLLYLAFVLGLYLGQRSYLYHPDQDRIAAARAGVPGLADVSVAIADGLALHAWYLPPPSAAAPVVMLFHGNGGAISDRLGHLRRFAAAGFGALLVEYRGYGGNPGSPTDAGLFADARGAVAFLAGEGIAPGRIVAYGESLGTGVAVMLAAETPVVAVVLEAPYTSMAAMARRAYAWVPTDLLLKDRFDSLSRIASVRAPLLVLQGTQDQVIPPEMGQTLYAAANEPKEIWIAPDGHHSDLIDHGGVDAAIDFIRRVVSSQAAEK